LSILFEVSLNHQMHDVKVLQHIKKWIFTSTVTCD